MKNRPEWDSVFGVPKYPSGRPYHSKFVLKRNIFKKTKKQGFFSKKPATLIADGESFFDLSERCCPFVFYYCQGLTRVPVSD